MDARQIIKRPIITEDSMLNMDDKKYTFEVDRRANKIQIRQAVEQLFDVSVEKVNVINTPGKPKRMGAYSGHTQKGRKAVVKLTADSNDIELFDLAEEDNE